MAEEEQVGEHHKYKPPEDWAVQAGRILAEELNIINEPLNKFFNKRHTLK